MRRQRNPDDALVIKRINDLIGSNKATLEDMDVAADAALQNGLPEYEIKVAIARYLINHDLKHDSHIYTQKEWHDREEKYGNEGRFTITTEGLLNHLVNGHGGADGWPMVEELDAFLSGGIGLYYELGYAWSMHLWPISERPWLAKDWAARATAASRSMTPALSGLVAAHQSTGAKSNPGRRRNPGAVQAPRAAVDMFEGFHRFAPRKIGEFHASFKIPSRVKKQGRAVDVLYRSDKTDPETLKKPRKPIDYIHDHDPGVVAYLVEGEGEAVETPAWLRDADALVLLGECLGFKFERGGRTVDAQGEEPLPELYTTANGRALVVVQGKREVIAMIWGGKLGVEPRGIVG